MEQEKTSIKIVRASAAHLADAQTLLQEYYEAVGVLWKDTPEQVRTFLDDASCGFWIAFAGEAVAGCVLLRPLASIVKAGECKRLYVRPKFRGQGVAGHLLAAMEEHAATAGLKWVYLDSKDDLHDALRIYKKRGYVACERYNENPQATIFLRRNIVGLFHSAELA